MANNVQRHVGAHSYRQGFPSRTEEIEHEKCASRCRDADHDPKGNHGHMSRRISNSIDHAHRGVQKVVPIQVITPSKGSGQDEKEYGKMRNGIPPGFDLSTAA